MSIENEKSSRPNAGADWQWGGYDVLSAYLGVPKATLYAWVSTRRIPHTRLSKRQVLFRRDVIDQWLASQAVPLGMLESQTP